MRDAGDRDRGDSRDAGAGADVDLTLIAWYRELSVVERLRAASRAAATLEKLRRAASADR